MELEKLKELKNSGEFVILEANRRKNNLKNRIIELLKQEALTSEEIKNKLNLKSTTAYNACRRYEIKGLLIAFEAQRKTYFIEKGKAKKEGLI